MGHCEETLADLSKAAERSSSVLVAYSGGKDAMVTMDLCVRSFKQVRAFHMFLVPGLECIQAMMDFAKSRWGITEILQYPHFCLPKLLKAGIYCPNHYSRDNLPELQLTDIYGAAMHDTGVHMIATGAKKADSIFRRKSWQKFEKDYLVYPLKDWSTRDVLGYLQLRSLPMPSMNNGHQTSGIDLTARDLLRVHDEFPRDFAKLEVVFPYVGAVVKRREWHGIAA